MIIHASHGTASHLEKPGLRDMQFRNLHELICWHDIKAELLAAQATTGHQLEDKKTPSTQLTFQNLHSFRYIGWLVQLLAQDQGGRRSRLLPALDHHIAATCAGLEATHKQSLASKAGLHQTAASLQRSHISDAFSTGCTVLPLQRLATSSRASLAGYKQTSCRGQVSLLSICVRCLVEDNLDTRELSSLSSASTS